MIAYIAPARPPAFIASVCGTHKGEDDHAFTPGEGWPTFRMLAASKQTALVALMFNTHNLLVTHGIAPVSYSPPPRWCCTPANRRPRKHVSGTSV